MNKDRVAHRYRYFGVLLTAMSMMGMSGCAEVLSLQPKGLAAERIADLWWFGFFLALPFLLAVILLLLLAIWRHRRGGEVAPRSRGMTMVIWGGAILPALAMLALMAFTTNTLVEVTEPAGRAELSVDVQGKMWWWKIGYESGEEMIFTANEIHIPVGEPVALELSSDNVIHSFWVPELNGKRDLIPGVPGDFWIQADSPGTFIGRCAEFCGAQHAKMHFLVIAHEPEEFEQWLAHELQPAHVFVEGDENFAAQQAFLGADCVSCHTIRGTAATGTLGPDLTHIGSRQELGAGTLPNVIGNMMAWIIDSQQFKPGNLMPPMPHTPEELLTIVAYLRSLG
jgi:cytochrome c oxidase subunit 2